MTITDQLARLPIGGISLIVRDRNRVPHRVTRITEWLYEVKRPAALGQIDPIIVCAGSVGIVAAHVERM